ncbi:Metallo-dependent phosphatase-like protein [Mycena metata]|uniref:Sphingomyelin phosphodiesterase n=1 Tax=Mycena metata TaxID=1033252 RepID=A0AAD7K260_9AGAR|nr:Metallo-dependent phosphatase-like protein [Mycena metata]
MQVYVYLPTYPHLPLVPPLSPPAMTVALGPSTFTAPGAFPTSVFGSYYNDPTQTSSQVQPVISDPVTNVVYPLSLTDPDTIPLLDTKDPTPFPPPASADAIVAAAIRQIQLIASPNTPSSPFPNDRCVACQAALLPAKFAFLAAPSQGASIAVALCEALNLAGSTEACEVGFGQFGLANILTQVISNADVVGYDGQAICNEFAGACPLPPTTPLNLTGWFAKPKPNPLPAARAPSGERLKVLHLSDFHIDPRYKTGAEANCTSGLCCREDAVAQSSPNVTLFPAPRFGSYLCDTPYALALAALESVPVLTGTQGSGFNFTIYTGDLISHDSMNELSRDYVLYTETIVYELFKKTLGSGPVYAALGNHDTQQTAQDSPHSLGGNLTDQFSWNYDHVAGLWELEGWIDKTAAQLARANYGAYMVQRGDGLRIITLNTDFWYQSNFFNYFNMTNPDTSGMLRFLTDELQDAEDAGDKVWILGHVLSGYSGGDAIENPTNLFYQIVDRFSPHVIANIFWGHSHMDHFQIYYSNNGTNMSAETAQAVSWIGPSITPLTDLNSGFRMYEVDSKTFEILDAYTWTSDVSSFPALDSQVEFGPTYSLEYNTRETYGAAAPGWGPNDPLNATWWHLVTEAMETNSTLFSFFNDFLTKQSPFNSPCESTCQTARICYMRSGSSSLAFQNCAPGF